MKPFVVLVAVDFSSSSDAVVLRAFEFAGERPRSEVHIVTVQELTLELMAPPQLELNSPSAPLHELAQRAVKRFQETYALSFIERVVTHGLVGDPAREIVALAAELDADLVVVGTHGRRGLRRIVLGSVAEKVVRTAGCPVFVVRPKAHAEALKAPELEPLCPQCAATRATSGGRELWCSPHAEHHVRGHVYSFDESSAAEARPWGFSP